jgi:uncharacterized membrane protein
MSENQQKRMSLLLVLSLVLNVFVIGAFAGGSFMHNKFGLGENEIQHAPPIRSFMNPRQLVEGTSPETRQKLMKVARKDLRALRPELDAVHKARREIHEIMTAETLDPKEFEQAIARLAEAEKSAQIASGETLIKMLGVLTPEERKELAENGMKRNMRDGHRRPRRPH